MKDKNLFRETAPSPYNFTFDPAADTTANRVVSMVGKNKDVLELGCAYGVMTQALVKYNGCRVSGIEIDAESAKSAEEFYEELIICNIDGMDWDSHLKEKRFDVILAADVIEHLNNPWECLANMRRFLAPGGFIVLSVPNMTHNGIIAELLTENFDYRKVGLLDKTHIRFFGWKSIENALKNAGFRPVDIDRMEIPPEKTEFHQAWKNLPDWVSYSLDLRVEGDVYQYIVKAVCDEEYQENRFYKAPTYNKFAPALDEMIADVRKKTVAQRDEAFNQRDEAFNQRDEAFNQRDEAFNQRDEAFNQRDEAIAERDQAVAEQNILKIKAAELLTELNTSRSELKAAGELIQMMQHSSSWRITRPLRQLARVYRYGFILEDRRRMARYSREKYHGLPIPYFVKNILSRIFHHGIQPMVRKISRKVISEKIFELPVVKPAEQQHPNLDYFVWGVINWHFRQQRPQHLAKLLANAGSRVFYISSLLTDNDKPGFTLEQIDKQGRLFEITLFAKGGPSIYTSAPCKEIILQLCRGIGEVLEWTDSKRIVSLVQHSFWYKIATKLPNCRVVYDCMDHHEGFGNTSEDILDLERELFQNADLTVTTSTWLDQIVAKHSRFHKILRNAGDFDHFSQTPEAVYKDSEGRPVIGYFGAIAEWFDQDLIDAVARQFPDCSVLLIGADTVNAKRRLGRHSNIAFTGEVPYARLPYYLHGFDVCLLPFKIVPLTLATNPVKVYEYLSAGKSVVAVNLPEMRQFGGIVKIAETETDFLDEVALSLNTPPSREEVDQRQEFARNQTWTHRVEELIGYIEKIEFDPLVSVIIVTYNNLDLTKKCLDSMEKYTDYSNLEIIVVDNASSDNTQDFLTQWSAGGRGRKIILNTDNRGFAAANNQGLDIAKGQYLTLLNNDTHVTPGWIRTLKNHLKTDESIGLIGPVTNNIGNEAKIDIEYDSMDAMLEISARYTRRQVGQVFNLRTVAFFCVMMRRSVYQQVGPLDEKFGTGFFEDDDYCRRIEQMGLSIACAEDTFIHHHLSASFDKLPSRDRQALFNRNKVIYEEKWGEWLPHSHRK